MATPTRLTTTPKALPPTYSIATMGATHLQASPAMALWMQTITNQAAAAIATLPPTNVTHTGTDIPANEVVIGAGSSQVQSVPDPGVPDEVLVSAGPGQAPRWRTINEVVRPQMVVQLAGSPIPPENLSAEQQAIINHIVALLYELIQISRTT